MNMCFLRTSWLFLASQAGEGRPKRCKRRLFEMLCEAHLIPLIKGASVESAVEASVQRALLSLPLLYLTVYTSHIYTWYIS